ncbi:MAG: hypothetical protein ABJK39_05705 [Hyphomicrobiales bacterium]
MSSIGSSFSPFQAATPSFLERLNLSESVDNADLTEAQQSARNEINALETALAESAPVGEGEEAATPNVLSFVSEQFQGENSDTAVAYLLDLAAQELNQPSDIDLEEGLEGIGADDLTETRALAQVLQFAVETNRLLQSSDASIGLRLDILGDLQNGLRDLQA